VTVDVPLSSISSVRKGEAASVQGAADATGIAGTVQSVSLLPTSSSSSTSTYAVEVLVPRPTASMASGSSASVAITVATAKEVVSVPNSALTTLTKGTATVEVITNGKAVRTLIKTGAVGPTSTQVTSGLSAGQQVALADLSAALPTTSSTTSRFGNRSSGGLTSSLSGSGGLGGGPPN
jgi:multidrug efflux pump subunit AcrA (membrane-fusion protein)